MLEFITSISNFLSPLLTLLCVVLSIIIYIKEKNNHKK